MIAHEWFYLCSKKIKKKKNISCTQRQMSAFLVFFLIKSKKICEKTKK